VRVAGWGGVVPAEGGYRRRPGNGVPGPGFDGAPGGGSGSGGGLGGLGLGLGPAEGVPGGGLGDPRLGGSGDGSGRSLVRPYAVTGGRTRPRTQLEIEAMVAAAHYEARDLSVLSPECQAILGFCRDWRSVAEVSAVLRMPLGVARILIADMAVEGLVRIHQLDHEQGRPDLNLLERVLSGLRKL
jgi:Protein of unknown function (DUF742)